MRRGTDEFRGGIGQLHVLPCWSDHRYIEYQRYDRVRTLPTWQNQPGRSGVRRLRCRPISELCRKSQLRRVRHGHIRCRHELDELLVV